MTEKEVNDLMQELSLALRELGIPVSRAIRPEVAINSRARRRNGCCYHQADGSCRIEVSRRLLEEPKLLRQTLVHELLHTCPGCMNHGKRWKAYAERANAAMGLSVQRLAQPGEEAGPLRHDPVHYVLECQSCGQRFFRRRMSKLVKYPRRYRCQCGGKLKRIL